MAFVHLDNDPWLIEYETLENLSREIEGILNVRDLEQKSSEKYVLCSSHARLRLKQYGDEVKQLVVRLQELGISKAITSDEEDRRHRMLELLHSKNILLNQRYLNNDIQSYLLNRQRLLKPSTSGAITKSIKTPTTGWLDSDDDDYNDDKRPLLNESTLRQQQQYLLKEQDDGLDELASIVSRQKNIAITISSEVDLQNELVDNLLVNMDKTSAGIENETKEVVKILKVNSNGGLWLIIILLFIANVFVFFT